MSDNKIEPSVSRRLAWFFLCVAIFAFPIAGKIPLGPADITVTDLALLVACALLARVGIKEFFSHQMWKRLDGPLPLSICTVMSSFSSTDTQAAVKELAQVNFYILAAAWAFSLAAEDENWRRWVSWTLRGGLVFGTVGCILVAMNGTDIFVQFFGTPSSLCCSVALIGCLCLVDLKGPRRVLGLTIVACVVLGLSILTWASRDVPEPGINEPILESEVPQRYLEGYAALNVLSQYPLLGVGLGNYQLHIGEFYQGMPKTNTIVPGSRIGYGVILASTGLLGLCGFCYWIARMWQLAANSALSNPAFHYFLVVLVLCVYFTPPFVSNIMLPLVVAHGLIQGMRVSNV